jgi:hypothetical protein
VRFEVAGRRARQEIEQVRRFNDDPRWRRGRIRDLVAAREVLIEIDEALHRGLPARTLRHSSSTARLAAVTRASWTASSQTAKSS